MIHVMRMPGVNANEDSAVLVRWMVDEGAPVKKGQFICEIETTKSTVEVEAEADGFIVPIAPPGASQQVGAPIAVIKADLAADHSALLAADGAPKGDAEKRWTKKAFIVARRLGIDIEALAKAKPGATLTEADVLAAQSGASDAPAAPGPEPAPAAAMPAPAAAPRAYLGLGQHFERVLLIGGASGAGAIAVEAILRTSHQRPAGIIDTNPKTHGQVVHGVPVLGDRTAFDVENWGFAAIRIGTVDDVDALAAVLKSAGNTVSPIAFGDANHGKALWEVVGLAADPGGLIGIYAHAIAAATGAGSMPFRFEYFAR